MPYCTNCGKTLSSWMNFCPNCGARIQQNVDLLEKYRRIINFQYDEVQYTTINGLFVGLFVKSNGKRGFIRRQGDGIPCEYDSLSPYLNSSTVCHGTISGANIIYIVENNGRYGVEVIRPQFFHNSIHIQCIYDHIRIIYKAPRFAIVHSNNRQYVLDIEQQKLILGPYESISLAKDSKKTFSSDFYILGLNNFQRLNSKTYAEVDVYDILAPTTERIMTLNHIEFKGTPWGSSWGRWDEQI